MKLTAVFNIIASREGSAMCMYQQGLRNSGEKSDGTGMMVCKAFKNDSTSLGSALFAIMSTVDILGLLHTSKLLVRSTALLWCGCTVVAM